MTDAGLCTACSLQEELPVDQGLMDYLGQMKAGSDGQLRGFLDTVLSSPARISASTGSNQTYRVITIKVSYPWYQFAKRASGNRLCIVIDGKTNQGLKHGVVSGRKYKRERIR